MKKKTIITAIIAGAALGAIGGILISSDKSGSFKKMIAKKGSDIRDALKHKLDEMIDTMVSTPGSSVERKDLA